MPSARLAHALAKSALPLVVLFTCGCVRMHFLEDGACANVTCGSHRHCVASQSATACLCDDGYHLQGDSCEPNATSPDLEAWLERASVKLRQGAAGKNASTLAIKAARNEFEPFQLALRSRSPLADVDVTISDFVGAPGTIGSENVTIMLEKYLDILEPSTADGATGEWPDALCPKVDAYYHEARSFFPFSLEVDRLQPIWLDLFVPAAAAPGDYVATIEVLQGDTVLFSGAVTLTVWDFSLPATATLRTSYGLSFDGQHHGHYGNVWEMTNQRSRIMELHHVYTRAGLRHRLSFTPLGLIFSGWNGVSYDSVDDRGFTESVAGFLGDGDPEVEYGAAQLTSIDVDLSSLYSAYVVSPALCTATSPAVTEPPTALLVEARERSRIYASYVRPEQRMLFGVLPIDVPGSGGGCGNTNPPLDYASTKALADVIHAEGLPVRITKARVPELLDDSGTNRYIDQWIVPFTAINGRSWDGSIVNTRSQYDADVAAGAQVWWFQSCLTHGCGIIGGESYHGYPQLLVDYDAIRNRIFPWLSFKFSMHGELYARVDGAYYTGPHGAGCGDPWLTIDTPARGNGEGTLFYPGVPNVGDAGLPYTDPQTQAVRGAHTPSIGGTTHIPIESFRLKMIREGMEDYEYLALLVSLGDEAFARAQVDALVENTFTYSLDPNAYEAAREAMAQRIMELQDQP